MSTEQVATNTTADLAMPGNQALDQNPAAVYLAGLSASSRRTMKGALDTIAGMLAEGADALTFPWAKVRSQHVQAIRSKLEEKHASSTTNRYLYARGLRRAQIVKLDVADYDLETGALRE